MSSWEQAVSRSRMWRITLTVAGSATSVAEVRDALQRLTDEHPFLMTGRYAADRAQIEYWDEATDVQDAAAMALRLWGEHRGTAGLPPWQIVGLELVDRDTWQFRGRAGYRRGRPTALARTGSLHPF